MCDPYPLCNTCGFHHVLDRVRGVLWDYVQVRDGGGTSCRIFIITCVEE